MIYKVPSLYYLLHLPPLAADFLLGTSWITLKIDQESTNGSPCLVE